MIRHITLAAFLLGFSSTAWAQAVEALPDGVNYPDPQCKKPQVNLIRPDVQVGGRGNAVDSGAVGSYNSKIKAFNRDAAAYNTCMHAYIDKANGDVKTIQDKANADLKQISERANASMKAIQDKIRQAVTDAGSVATALDQETAKLRSR
ncbi:MAG TPA: hypothetical protein VN175_00990 [Rhizomicrobium sp.]|nr:hypothetical protein [Rhizomicrobium sp.]